MRIGVFVFCALWWRCTHTLFYPSFFTHFLCEAGSVSANRDGVICRTTTIWDVRTKKVAWEEVPTLDNVAGISVYGPKGALFTLGRDNTVQQFALYPPTLLANVHQAPAIPPPSPPVSIEEKKEEAAAAYEAAYAAAFQTAAPAYQQSAEPAYQQAAEPAYAAAMDDEERAVAAMSPLGRIAHELEQLEKMEHPDGGLGISNMPRERAASVSSRSSQGSRTSASHARKHSYSGSPAPRPPQTARSSSDASDYSTASAGHKGSVGTLSALASPRKQHPLRQEIHLSPDQTVAAQQLASPVAEVAEVADLFPNLRTRIATVVYESPRIGSPNIHLSDDDLRREMLYCIFGWKGDIEALISDERKYAGRQRAVSQWRADEASGLGQRTVAQRGGSAHVAGRPGPELARRAAGRRLQRGRRLAVPRAKRYG